LKIGTLRFGQFIDLGYTAFERGGENVFRSRFPDKIGHLLEHFLDDKTRWQNLLLFPYLQVLEHLIKLSRQSFDPHQVILAILGVQQPVRVCHKRGELILHAEELVNRIGMPLPFLSLDLDLQKPIQNVCGKFLRRRLPIERVLAKLRQVAFPPVKFPLLMRR
jgi:hypothetical protein